MLNLLSKLVLRRIDNEVQYLKELRNCSEEWYNELTSPIMPLLVDKGLLRNTSDETKYIECAEKLLNQVYIINSGEKIENIFIEMGKRGITINSRTNLTPLIEEYVDSGIFLKKIAYNFEPETAHSGWKSFEMKKNKLVSEINEQLKNIR